MIVILESPTGKRKWRIEPFDSGMCFKILKTPIGYVDTDGVLRSKKNGKEIKGEWIDCKIYPSTLEYAVEKVIDLMLADPEDEITMEFSGIDMRTGMEKIFKRWLNKIKKEIEND